MLWHRLCLAVDIDCVVDDFQALSGQAYGAFHKIDAAVDGAVFYFAESLGMLLYIVASEAFDKKLVIFRRLFKERDYGVACRKVEHDDVACLDRTQAGEAVVGVCGSVEIAVATQPGKFVMDEREMDGSHGHPGAVDKLVYPQIVAGEQGLFQRRRGYHIILADEGKHEIHKHQRVDYCVDPSHHGAHRRVRAFLPPCERYVACDIYVEKKHKAKNPPPVAEPGHPCGVYCGYGGEADPTCCLDFGYAFLEGFFGHCVIGNGLGFRG